MVVFGLEMMQWGVFLFYTAGVIWIVRTIWWRFASQAFSFHLFFSVVYLVTFYFGFPFSWLMGITSNHTLPHYSVQLRVLVTALLGYGCYQWGYAFVERGFRNVAILQPPDWVKISARLTAYLLAVLGLGTLCVFIGLNEGFLLFKLEKYHQIFSAQVQGVALKRFFYFFLPAMLFFFLLQPTRKRWGWFLCFTSVFGLLSYLAVGGTRANLALAVLFFILLGIHRRFLSLKWLIGLALGGVLAMFGLALVRYHLDLQGLEIWHTFLYLTRDTFSPWENVAKIFDSQLTCQGLMPFVRDFYVYIPQRLWQDRPEIVWNTANYFTKVILGNQSGLAMSPTLLGSFYIMGGYAFILIGMGLVGGMLSLFDCGFRYAEQHSVTVLQVYCLGNLFNFIVLIREGADAFVSRFCFFSLVFGFCWGVAVLMIQWGKQNE